MQVSLENVGVLGRRLTVALPAQELENAYSERLKRLSREVKLPGFRPGKVPVKVVEQQYGARLLEEAAGDLIQSSLKEALGRQGLRPAGGPHIEPRLLKRGEELRYTAEFEVYPEITAANIAGVGIERPRATISDADIAHTIETIRTQRTRYVPVSRAAQQGDRVVVDFVGRKDGKPFDGGAGRDIPVVIGSHTFLEDFESGLVGARAGEKRTIAATFPTGYQQTALAGERAEFDAHIKEVGAPEIPALDEALARDLGVPSGSLDELRGQVRQNLEREAARRAQVVVRARVMKSVLAQSRVEVPQALVDDQLQRMVPVMAASDGERREHARRRAALSLVFGETIRKLGIVPDAAGTRAKLESLAQEYESPDAFVRWHYEQPGRLAEIEALVMEERVIEELLKTAMVTDKDMAFQDLLKIEESI